ncbi:hypothetical protein STAS_02447 [Striga asiatica]|uniref:Uncharacterized protein n=1 Tax=Striga asiatica TaxID=4170 RepID=A0A5A7P1U0_STRAF|nr:hypothetical protein STAS_02447 [Striga asiatica]
MVGIFSRLSVKSSHRRAQSTFNEMPRTLESTNVTRAASNASIENHGIEIGVEFKPIEHPTEPLDYDQPIQCPLPEPSILNDGRIWKERVSANVKTRADMQDQTGGNNVHDTRRTKTRAHNRVILPSVSAPEHNILKLLEECNASGIN